MHCDSERERGTYLGLLHCSLVR